ncbi:hypothetical protein IAU59_002262 [Kwoniella sp. CBS 9459]
MVAFDQLPEQILQRIILHVPIASDHLRLPRVCPALAKAYTARIHRALCLKYGFSRSKRDLATPSLKLRGQVGGGHQRRQDDETKRSWQSTFCTVVQHSQTCCVDTCSPYGLPAPLKCWTPNNVHDFAFPPAIVGRKIHPFLTHLGHVNLETLLSGLFSTSSSAGASTPANFLSADHTSRPLVTLDGRTHQLQMHKIADHPILPSAFCCQPPATCVSIRMGLLLPRTKHPVFLALYNKDGVTVGDVIIGLSRWFATLPSGMDTESLNQQRQELYEALDNGGGEEIKCYGYGMDDDQLSVLMSEWHDCKIGEEYEFHDPCDEIDARTGVCVHIVRERHTYGDWYADWIRQPALRAEPEAMERIMGCNAHIRGYVGMEITMITEERGRLC